MISNVVQRGGWYWIYDENGKRRGKLQLVMVLLRLLLQRFLLNMETKFGFLMKKGIKQDLVLLAELFRAKIALGIVTPWGGDSRQSCIAFLDSEAPF